MNNGLQININYDELLQEMANENAGLRKDVAILKAQVRGLIAALNERTKNEVEALPEEKTVEVVNE
jgi:hypothetical protein